MKVDFFKVTCQKKIKVSRFGLCDDDDKKPAYTDTKDERKWIATVINNFPKEITFTAIDNCVPIFKDSKNMDSRCDVMLNYENTLMLVELKHKRKDWKSQGLGQIEATLKKMLEHERTFYYGFKKRKAIVANSKFKTPCFEDYDAEQREYFKKNYKIRLQFDAEIIIT